MSSLAPTVKINVENKINPQDDDLSCELTFKSIKDFSPEKIVESVPTLNKLISMRNLLKDLKANVLDNQSFRKKLEMILQDEQQTKTLSQELKLLMDNKQREQV